MTARVFGLGVAVLGACAGILPFLGWYRVDLPGRVVVVRGVDVRGELWSLPVLAGIVVAIGVYVAASDSDPREQSSRWLAGICAVAGALCLAWALWSAWRISSVAVPLDLGDGPQTPLRAQPVALLAAAAASGIVAMSLKWVRGTSS